MTSRRENISVGWVLAATVLCGALWVAPAAGHGLVPAEQMSTENLIAEIVEHADEGEPTAVLAQEAGRRGMVAAELAARHLDAAHPRRNAALYRVIALAARERRWPAELMQLYDPPAYRIFHTPAGLAVQERFAVGLAWADWPQSLPAAVVQAAPGPTLAWLARQAAAKQPKLDRIRKILLPWGWWVRTRRERTRLPALRDALAKLSGNPAVAADADTCAALLRLIGEAEARKLDAFAAERLRAGPPAVRIAAARALGALRTPAARAALLARAAAEKDPQATSAIAAASQHWPKDPEMGRAMLALFARTNDSRTRRDILYSAAKSAWPQRQQVLLAAFDSPEEGVLGVALQAAAAGEVGPRLNERILALLPRYDKPESLLIDATGAAGDARAVPHLLRWLAGQKNLAVRMKIALALEKIGGQRAKAALARMLREDRELLTLGQLIDVADRMGLAAAGPDLVALADNPKTARKIRRRAIWALGQFDRPEIRTLLDKLDREADTLARDGESLADADRAEELGVFVTMARFRMRLPGARGQVLERYRNASPGARLTMLMLLGAGRRDHAIIGLGLRAEDFMELLAAVYAAGAADPAKYRPSLRSLRESRFLTLLLGSSVDTVSFEHYLDEALAADKKEPKP